MRAETLSGVELAAEHGGHYVEESVSVYLMGDPAGAGRWVIDPTTVSGEALESTLDHGPEFGNCECGGPPAECRGRAGDLLGVPLPDGAELAGMLVCALTVHGSGVGPARVEVVVVRDPDGLTDVRVFVGGVAVEAAEYCVDAGAGWEWNDWREHRDRCLSSASEQAYAVLRRVFADPPGGGYVVGREGCGWLDGAPDRSGV